MAWHGMAWRPWQAVLVTGDGRCIIIQRNHHAQPTSLFIIMQSYHCIALHRIASRIMHHASRPIYFILISSVNANTLHTTNQPTGRPTDRTSFHVDPLSGNFFFFWLVGFLVTPSPGGSSIGHSAQYSGRFGHQGTGNRT